MVDEIKRVLKCRKCSHCKGIMIQSMCIEYNELVCVPCQIGVPVFNDNEEIFVSHKEHDALYELYTKDINKMAFEMGGASCTGCGNYGGNNCDKCNIDYDYEFKVKEEKEE